MPAHHAHRHPHQPSRHDCPESPLDTHTHYSYGLPGSLPPVGEFDPLGFAQKGISLNDVKRNREAEVTHGRVAMLAAVGYLAGEAGSPVVWNGEIGGPANDQLAQIPGTSDPLLPTTFHPPPDLIQLTSKLTPLPGPLFAVLTLFIGSCEAFRAVKGWQVRRLVGGLCMMCRPSLESNTPAPTILGTIRV